MEKLNIKKSVDIIVDFLADKKVDTVFDLTGGMIVYLEDAISKKVGMKCFPMHHEQAAGFAAEGYSRQAQNFGVAISTSGPGALNLMTPIGSCYFDSVPAMFITGNVNTKNIKKSDKVRQDGFQETDIVSVVKPITKYAVIVKDPNDIVYELEKAFFIMNNDRPGPVLIDIPINNQYAEVDINSVRHFVGSKDHLEMTKQVAKISDENIWTEKLDLLQKYLNNSKAPLVLVGNGVRISKTTKELEAFIERSNLPVVSSMMGLDSCPFNDKFVGLIGSNGNRSANIVLANADLIIVLGSRLDVRQTGGQDSFNNDAILIHVDVDNFVIDYDIKSTLSINANLVDFFRKSIKITCGTKKDWLDFISSIKSAFDRDYLYSNTVNPNTFVRDLSLCAPLNTTVVFDVGQNQMWGAQSWVVKSGHRLLFSGGMGSMGFSIPAAIGATVAKPGNCVISINGDGGFQMNMQELETIARCNLPVKIIVLNNSSLGMVKEFQDLYLNGNYQSTVIGYGCPNLEKISNAFGINYLKINNIKPDCEEVRKIIESSGPVLIEVVLDINTPLQPKVVFGHKLDDQAPYLDSDKKALLEKLKEEFKTK